MEMATAQIKSTLVEKYRDSKYAKMARARSQEISKIEGLEVETKSGSQATWWKQLTTLTKRSFVNMCRDVGYYWARIVIYILVSICVGTVFYDVGYGNTAILARVFNKERLNGYYGVAAYTLSNFLSAFPFLVTISLITGTITFYLVKFRSGFSHYAFFCLNIFFSIAVIESLMMVVASLVPNYLMGIVTGAGIIGILMMTSGFFRLLPDLPKIFWRYPISYISFSSWALQGAYKNDFMGLEFDPLLPGDRKLTGDEIITKYFGVTVDRSKWWDLTAVVVILICYRLIFFIILKMKEKASPFLQEIYAKKTLEHLDKRPSFRKVPSLASSKRHQPLHSLPSQEGLNSPLH
ncbi:hypothetical protein Goshw_021816 [Gossypium schwendimanii]|uniref:ABC-2 type transporter transmembrane domain-containing protein n=1 Tax=Gossypium schwendimanii TaxID=34291 RepID=A0A7J9M6B2_GOSSC|nr:hypothetical protein [Gossypium schwendimanii]